MIVNAISDLSIKGTSMAVTTTALPPNAAHLETVHMTVAQATVTFLSQQFIEIDCREQRVCAGGFGIFGHGNAPSLGEALHAARNELPLYRGQNEQSMGFAAVAYAKVQLRRRFMFCTASAGIANLLTAAALAQATRWLRGICGSSAACWAPLPVGRHCRIGWVRALGCRAAFCPDIPSRIG